jgi:hypothetical protein
LEYERKKNLKITLKSISENILKKKRILKTIFRKLFKRTKLKFRGARRNMWGEEKNSTGLDIRPF